LWIRGKQISQMASGGGVGDGEEEIRIGDRVYFITTYLGGGGVGAEEGHGDHDGGREDFPLREALICATSRYYVLDTIYLLERGPHPACSDKLAGGGREGPAGSAQSPRVLYRSQKSHANRMQRAAVDI
jgi:hypothetical protein